MHLSIMNICGSISHSWCVLNCRLDRFKAKSKTNYSVWRTWNLQATAYTPGLLAKNVFFCIPKVTSSACSGLQNASVLGHVCYQDSTWPKHKCFLSKEIELQKCDNDPQYSSNIWAHAMFIAKLASILLSIEWCSILGYPRVRLVKSQGMLKLFRSI